MGKSQVNLSYDHILSQAVTQDCDRGESHKKNTQWGWDLDGWKDEHPRCGEVTELWCNLPNMHTEGAGQYEKAYLSFICADSDFVICRKKKIYQCFRSCSYIACAHRTSYFRGRCCTQSQFVLSMWLARKKKKTWNWLSRGNFFNK